MKLLRNTLLETFVTVVDCGGFSDAQFALGITQSAISVRIRDLETLLGYRVCERGRGGFRLTEQGEIAYEKARVMLRSARDFDAELLELRNRLTGDLRVGLVDAVSSLPGLNLAQAFGRFLARPNDVRLEIVVGSPSELTQKLITGALNVAIAPFRTRVPDLIYEDLCSEEHRLYCGQGHPLFAGAGQGVLPADIARYPVCRRSYDMIISQETAGPESRAVVSNMEAMALLVESGHYLGALPTHFAEPRVQSGQFREVVSRDLRWQSVFSLATRDSQVHRRAVELFLEDIRSVQ
jgi:DNA-binding transcriptional LysR family regulator